jgi:GTP-binding protein
MKVTDAKFIMSNTDFQKCPEPVLPEYAFIGRSNVGKSSLINMLTGQKNLAKTSGTPGKTQLINHFLINENWYLVDLPGYGFAKSSKKNRADWKKMIKKYLLGRTNLVSTFILIDSRLDPQKVDIDFISWFGEMELPFILVFTKTDKITKAKLSHNIEDYKEYLLQYWEQLPVMILSSAKSSNGKEDILKYIEEMNQTVWS